MFSNAKEENVVNPPKNPINKSSLSFSSNNPLTASKPYKNPINNEPVILTKKIPVGNEYEYLAEISSESQKRIKLPAAPPARIYTYFIHVKTIKNV